MADFHNLVPWTNSVTGSVAALAPGASTAVVLASTTLGRYILAVSMGGLIELRTALTAHPLFRSAGQIPFLGFIPYPVPQNDNALLFNNVGGSPATFQWTIVYADAPPNIFSDFNVATT